MLVLIIHRLSVALSSSWGYPSILEYSSLSSGLVSLHVYAFVADAALPDSIVDKFPVRIVGFAVTMWLSTFPVAFVLDLSILVVADPLAMFEAVAPVSFVSTREDDLIDPETVSLVPAVHCSFVGAPRSRNSAYPVFIVMNTLLRLRSSGCTPWETPDIV